MLQYMYGTWTTLDSRNSLVTLFAAVIQDPWPAGSITALAQRSARWLVTRGEHGAHEMTASGTSILPAEKVDP